MPDGDIYTILHIAQSSDVLNTPKVVITVAYKGSGKKSKIQNSGGKRSAWGKGVMGDLERELDKALNGNRKSKAHNSRKTHDAKGRDNHGRSRW